MRQRAAKRDAKRATPGVRRVHVLAGSALVSGAVGIALVTGVATPDVDARIPGAALQPAAAVTLPTDEPILSPSQVPPTGTRAPEPAAQAEPAIAIDLSTITAEGDHYVARLRDGRHAVLTLDPDLQHTAEKLLDESRAPRAAIVAMTPDGKILALAGRRTASNKGSRDGTFDASLAVEAWAPSASVFKLATATALVEAGVDPDGRVCFHGGIRSVMESNLRDDRHDNRCESLSYGVAHSNNAILGKLAFQNLDPHKLAAAAEQLHWTTALPAFGGAMGKLELPDDKNLEFARDAAGFITDDDANHDLRGAHLSAIGGALIAATFANDGARPAPQLVASIDGTEVPRAPHQRAIPAATAHAVAKMMEKTCSIGSAAKSFRRRRVHAAGKTGTLTRTEPFYMQHSWFVGFAPADHPEIVVAVVLGNPERWYLRGHEAARRLIDRATRREKGRTRSNRS